MDTTRFTDTLTFGDLVTRGVPALMAKAVLRALSAGGSGVRVEYGPILRDPRLNPADDTAHEVDEHGSTGLTFIDEWDRAMTLTWDPNDPHGPWHVQTRLHHHTFTMQNPDDMAGALLLWMLTGDDISVNAPSIWYRLWLLVNTWVSQFDHLACVADEARGMVQVEHVDPSTPEAVEYGVSDFIDGAYQRPMIVLCRGGLREPATRLFPDKMLQVAVALVDLTDMMHLNAHH